jgi:enoyl-CoA hydratase/carnithine racemase
MAATGNRTPLIMGEYTTLIVERRGRVGWLLFDRPQTRNAMNRTMRDELGRAWIELDEDDEVRVIVCSGEGGSFSSGVDLADLTDPEGAAVFRRDIEEPDTVCFTSRNQGVRKPVIAAVNGLCVGGAFMWVVDADIAIAASDAQFVDPHTTIGQVVGRGSWGMVPNVPFDSIMRLSLLGRHERLSARRAFSLGLVTQIVDPPERLQDEAQALAELIARNSPAALAASKRAMWRTLQLGLDDACRAATDDIVAMWTHPDQAEGPSAFAQKREPQWQPLPPR